MGEKLLEKVFSIKNEYKNNKKYKVIRICGLKIKSNLSKNKGYIPYLETHLCDHCNLNCKGCGYCSPLVTKETFADIKASQFFNQANIKGDSPIVETFNNCLSKYCVNLWRSKLYTCPACYSYYYNQYFGKNGTMPIAFDFYKLSGKELAEKLNKPIDFCRFCNTKELKYYKWDQSKKEIAEWE